MNTKSKLLLLPLGWVLLSTVLGGCTVAGFVAGAHMDSRNRADVRATGQHSESVPKGCQVQVSLANGNTVSGILDGKEELPIGNYTSLYKAACTALDSVITLPTLGSPLAVTTSSGKIIRQRFAGFGSHSLILQSSLTSDWERPHRVEYSLAKIRNVRDSAGNSYPVEQLRQLSLAQQLPLRSSLVLKVQGSTVRVPLQSVSLISSVPRRTHYALTGLLVGAFADALIVTLVGSAMVPLSRDRWIWD